MTTSGDPGPGGRRLERPPSERYRPTDRPVPVEGGKPRSRALLLASLATLVLGAAITAAGILEITAGLIAVAAIGGWAVAWALRPGGLSVRDRLGMAVALAVVGVVLGQVGLWIYGRIEGGVLGPLDFLAEVYGPLVVLEVAAAAVAAWWTAR